MTPRTPRRFHRLKVLVHIALWKLDRTLERARRDLKGVAAVEFALLLPVMLLMYIGTAELTTGLMANRKMTQVARTVSDLIAREAESNINNDNLQKIFAAGAVIMSPYLGNALKITASSVRFVPNSSDATNLKAMTVWTYTNRASTPKRPCGANALQSAPNTADATMNTVPAGLYQPGSVIIADVEYRYNPKFGGALLNWSTSSDGAYYMKHSTYMKPRINDEVGYNDPNPLINMTVCNPAPPSTWS